MYELLAIIALMCCSIYLYWRVRLRRWLVLALGLFLLTSNVISTTIIQLLQFLYGPYKWIDLASNLELIIASTMIAVGLSLILKRT